MEVFFHRDSKKDNGTQILTQTKYDRTGVVRWLYGNKPNGNWHDAIKRLSLRLFRSSVFGLPFIQLRASFHFSLFFF